MIIGGPGRLLYKCRHCGVIDASTHVQGILHALAQIRIDGRTTDGMARALDMHSCIDGTIGITDLVGGKLD